MIAARFLGLLVLIGHVAPASAQERRELHWLVRVDPVEIGARPRDEMPAEVVLDCGKDRALDPSLLRIFRADATGKPSPAERRCGARGVAADALV